MGLAAEASIPSHLRWIPSGMDVSYKKAAKTALLATCELPDDHFELETYPGEVSLPVSIRDEAGVEVSSASVRLWISEKKGR
jgi:hypothetical protein